MGGEDLKIILMAILLEDYRSNKGNMVGVLPDW
jgi:hypothetical protein